MGRPREGWKIRKPKGQRCYTVRFTFQGRQLELGTGEEREEAAAVEAARIYAETLSGRRKVEQRRKPQASVGGERGVREVGAAWLTDLEGTLDETTIGTYAIYLNAHFSEWFGTIDKIRTELIIEYFKHRLQCVKQSSVKKERSALVGFVEFCVRTKLLDELPDIPRVPEQPGTAHPRGSRVHTELTPKETLKWIAALPERSRGKWPIRARFEVAYWTTLRPATLSALSVPEHYTKGARYLSIEAQHDKARYARLVPLSKEARAALDRVCPEKGLIFGHHDYRPHLEKAAKKALPPEKARTVFAYELRGAGITHKLEETGNLPGVQYLAGHKYASTTALYVRSSLRAAEEVVSPRKVSGVKKRKP